MRVLATFVATSLLFLALAALVAGAVLLFVQAEKAHIPSPSPTALSGADGQAQALPDLEKAGKGLKEALEGFGSLKGAAAVLVVALLLALASVVLGWKSLESGESTPPTTDPAVEDGSSGEGGNDVDDLMPPDTSGTTNG